MWPLHLVFFYPRWNPDDTQWWQYLFPVAVLLVLALVVEDSRLVASAVRRHC